MSKTIHNLKKHVQVRLRIETIAPGGQGFARHESLPVFVDRGVPGDLAEVELYDIRKNFSQARIVQILEPSPLRVEPPCKLFSVCGGCQWQHISAEAQLELKKDMVCQAVEHIGGLDPKIVLPALSSPQTLHYRNKVQYPVGSPSKSTRILAGYYKENSHELINIKHCPVQPEILDQVLEAAKSAAELSGFSAYDEKTHRGLLRHIILRYSFASQETLVTVVLNAAPASFAELESRLNKFAGTLMDACPSVAGFCLNFNNQRGNRIMGKQTKLVRGREFIVEKLASKLQHAPEILRAGLQFQLSPASFFQVNSSQAEQLMDLVLAAVTTYIAEKDIKRVPLILDAYAGVACIALWVSALAEQVLAVEEVPEAVQNAQEIIRLNGITNVEPRCGTVEKILPQLLQAGIKPQIIILDPPRKGVETETLECVAALNPERIIYVSCNPSTLARDLKILSQAGYTTKSIRPVDLFPQTFHVESVSVLDRT